VKENKPGFVFNTVLPYGVYGRVIEPFKQSLKTTGTAVKLLYDGGRSRFWDFSGGWGRIGILIQRIMESCT
jgi:hypothetical protein